VLEFLHAGDVLMVTRIDRLARSIGDLQDIVRTVRARGAVLKATEQPIDTATAAGKCFLDMVGVSAEFETNLRRERQLEGIAPEPADRADTIKAQPAAVVPRTQGAREDKVLTLFRPQNDPQGAPSRRLSAASWDCLLPSLASASPRRAAARMPSPWPACGTDQRRRSWSEFAAGDGKERPCAGAAIGIK
jgi:hypothetical protein